MPANLKATINLILLCINTGFALLLFIPLALAKVVSGWFGNDRIAHAWLLKVAALWVRGNRWLLKTFTRTRLSINGLDELPCQRQYLITCNHQSWVDIVALQSALIDKLPFITFFLKRQLIWVPFMGFAWWALDFPFMRRHSQQEIKANPALAGKDLQTTQKFCERLRGRRTSVLNFAEGTRRTPQKATASPFEHLLRPKAGGLAFTLASLPEPPDHLIDITIDYRPQAPSLWQLLGGKVERIDLDVRSVAIPEGLDPSAYIDDPQQKQRFQDWLNRIWEEKDARLESARSGQVHAGR